MSGAGVPPVVLVVDDELAMRRFLRASLGSHGFRVVEAATAAEAIAAATSHNPELILLDLGLSDGDGVALTRSLREWSRVPIIVVGGGGGAAAPSNRRGRPGPTTPTRCRRSTPAPTTT